MRVSFTSKALAVAREQIAALGDPSATVIIFHDVPDTDLKRGPNGEAVWVRQPLSKWRVSCMPLAEWPIEFERAVVDGIPVALYALSSRGAAHAFHIGVARGKLYATADA